MKNRWPSIFAVSLLIALGAGARLGGAWCYRHGDNPDYGIVALMARHMAEGRDFPVFFYGQAYMGSLEPAVSALMCRMFGFSGFAVCLGTALVGIMLLPVAYVWARDACGRVAGIAALAYVILGPEGYFHYQSSPRGGYAMTLLLGPLIIWMACRMALRESNDPERSGSLAARIFLLGILAGLGFWSNMLILSALLTAALVLAYGFRKRIFSLPVLCGIPGFLLGSLPFWLWNARHGWQSFAMTSSFGESSPGMEKGLKLFWGPRLVSVLDLQETSPFWRFVILGLHLGLGVLVVLFLVKRLAWRRRLPPFASSHGGGPAASRGDLSAPLVPRDGQAGRRLQAWNRGHADWSGIYIAAALVFVVISSLLFSISTFAIYNSPRYLLPLIPVFGVVVGCATALLWEMLPRLWRPAAFIPAVVLICWQTTTLPNHFMREARYADQRREALDLGAFLEEHDIRHICTPYILHGLNYILEERFAFADIQRERCGWLAEELELAEQVAAMNNCGGLSEFIDAAGGDTRYKRFEKMRLHYDVRPPEEGMAEIPADRWESAFASGAEPALEVLSDADRGTSVSIAAQAGETDRVDVVFRRPETVTGVRLICKDWRYPVLWQVQGRRRPDGPWEQLSVETSTGAMRRTTHFFWSGPRPYWSGRHLRMECRFRPVEVHELRVRMQAHPRLGRVELAEMQLFGPAGKNMPSEEDFRDLVGLLRQRGIERLYADRWEANRVHVMTGGTVWTSREREIFERLGDDMGPEWVVFDANTALLAAEGAVSRTRLCLGRTGVGMRETVVGPWTLFDFEQGSWREDYRDCREIIFRGFGCELARSHYRGDLRQ